MAGEKQFRANEVSPNGWERAICYICGADGSGKTTQCERLIVDLKAKQMKVKHVWLRYPKLLSKPLMVYCRLAGLTRYWYVDGIRVGKHEFYRSWLVSRLYPWLQLIDLAIVAFFSVRLAQLFDPSRVIVMDRFAIDTLVDVMTDTRRPDLLSTSVGRGYVKVLPPTTRVAVLYVPPGILRHRRKDVEHDATLEERQELFMQVARQLNLPVVDAGQTLDETYRQVSEKLLGTH